MNWVDLVVIAVVACSALLAFMRGFVREVLGIGAWVAAGFVAAAAFPYVQPRFRLWLENPDLADPAAYIVAFVVALVFLSIIAGLVGGVIRGSMLGGIDRTLGVVFGIARGAALVAFAYVAGAMVVTADHWPEPVQQARLLPFAYQGAVWATGFLPEAYRPHIDPPPAGRETRAADLLHATPQGRAVARP